MKKQRSTSQALALREQRALTAKEFLDLADVPPEVEWFANITNRLTRRAYQNDLRDFMRFAGIKSPEEFRVVTRAHLIAWRKDLEARGSEGSTIRRKLSAVSSLFEYLCERNAVVHNPVKGVKRPKANNNEGLTPALSDEQARLLLHVRRLRRPSKASATGPFLQRFFTTAYAGKSSARSASGICISARACSTFACTARATRPATFRSRS
jgi:site-specific recombinase XerD